MKTKTSIIILLLITTNIVLYIMFMQSSNEVDLLSNQASAIYISISVVLMLIVMCNIIVEQNGKSKQ